MPKRITLINPPWYFARPRDIVLSQNLGLGYLAAYLKAQGHSIIIIDSLAEGYGNIRKIKGRYQNFYQAGLDYKKIANKIPANSDYIGITAPFTNNAKIVKDLSCVLKKALPKIPIVMGGVYPSLTPDEARCGYIDYYVIGEGEIALSELMSGKTPGEIKGVNLLGDGAVSFAQAEIIMDLDKIPFSARDKLPMDKYLGFYSPRREKLRSVSLITSRGCPFDCNFCSIHLITGRLWRKRSSGNVLEEIASLIKAYDIEHVEFEDDNLTVDKERAAQIFQGIEKINKDIKKISWSTPNGVKIDTLDKGLLEIIKKSNCLSLSFGIESGDPEILKNMNKNISLEKVTEIIGICKQIGIKASAFFMIGYPGETKESFDITISFVKKLRKAGVDNFYHTVTRAYPGTKLFDFCQKNNCFSDDLKKGKIFLGNKITKENTITTPEFNTKTLMRRQALFEKTTVPFYLRFYHRYFYIIKAVISDKIIRAIKALVKK